MCILTCKIKNPGKPLIWGWQRHWYIPSGLVVSYSSATLCEIKLMLSLICCYCVVAFWICLEGGGQNLLKLQSQLRRHLKGHGHKNTQNRTNRICKVVNKEKWPLFLMYLFRDNDGVIERPLCLCRHMSEPKIHLWNLFSSRKSESPPVIGWPSDTRLWSGHSLTLRLVLLCFVIYKI